MRISLSSPVSAHGNFFAHFSSLLRSAVKLCLSQFRKALLMGLSPLRRVVCRTLEVFEFHRTTPRQFLIHDELDCGHIYTSCQWGLLDLINPYTKERHVKAKHHRCRECAAVIAKKRPQDIRVAAQRRTA